MATATTVPHACLPTGLRCPCCGARLTRVPCAACGTAFLEADGIPCLTDPRELREDQGAMLVDGWLARDESAAEAACAGAAALDPFGVPFRERSLEGVFALAHYPERCGIPSMAADLGCNAGSVARLVGWLDEHAPPRDAPSPAALDAGCGPGRLLFDLAPRFPGGAIGFDLRVGLLRIAKSMIARGEVALPWRASGRRFVPLVLRAPRRTTAPIALVQGDLRRAPFEPGAFPLVAALSLLDVLPDPAGGLGSLDALVAAGGLLLVASPYQWQADVTPPHRWWYEPERALRGALGERGYSVLEEEPDLPWAVPSHARLVHRYSLHALLARKTHGR